MYYLDDPKRKFTLFINYRVASRSLEAWFHSLGHDEPLPHRLNDSYAKLQEDTRKIIVVRDPIDRFVSMLNHPSAFGYDPVKYVNKNKVEEFLTFLESGESKADAHFDLQSRCADSENIDMRGLFTDIVRIEDGSPTEQLNKLLGVEGDTARVNVTAEKVLLPINKHGFDYTLSGTVSKDDLTSEQINRIKGVFKQDFLNFYPL